MRGIRQFIRDSIPIHARISRRVQYVFLALLMLLAIVVPAIPVQAENASIGLRLPWVSGDSRIAGGNTYGCGDHTGKDFYALDFQVALNRPLSAVAAGVAHTASQYDSSGMGYGKFVWIAHANGYVSMYTHLNSYAPGIDGQQVQQGQLIGYAGNSGTGPVHLHFSLRKNATTQFDGVAAEPTPMSGYSDFGSVACQGFSQTYNPAANPPGGWWLAPTPADNSLLMPGTSINAKAHGVSNGHVGLDKINMTYYQPNQGWQTSNSVSMNGISEGDATGSIIMPDLPYVMVSFDVYTKDGSYQKSPSGTRKFCNAMTSSTCTHNPGDGGMGSGGGGGSACTTLPITSASVNGATPGNQGWWRSSVTVTLSANAPCDQAGAQTYYRVDGGSQSTYTSPIALNQEGVHTVSFFTVDGLGNTEASSTVQAKLDWTPPTTNGTATGPRDTNGLFRDNVTVGLNGTDNLSGVDFQKYSLNGGTNWTTVTGATNSFPITGNGISRALYYSTDIAGNIEQPPKDSGPIIINKYTIFANNAGQSLRFLFNGGGTNISGDLFTNGTTNIDWDTGSTYGTTFKTVGTNNVIGMYNTGTTIPTIQTGVQPVPMLAYPLSLYQSLATVVFPSSLYMDSVGTSLKDTIYVNGNVDMYNVGLGGSLSIVATGTINDWTTSSTYSTNDPNNGMLLYAGQNMNINSTGNRNLGLMYAPNGTIKIDGATGLDLKGSLVADQVEVNSATGFKLSYSPAFASSSYPLPLAAMGLVKPTGTMPPLAGVPSRYTPANNATVNKSGVNLGWTEVSGAAGYQLQIAKSTSFSPVEYDKSTMSGAHRAKLLSSGTTYYWRVRSVNQAGLSAWSTTGTFRTQ